MSGTMPGLGVMLRQLCGESERSGSDYYGLTIREASFGGDKITIVFDPCQSCGSGKKRKIVITDEGQSCCEHRYMTTDDKLEDLIGGKLVSITVHESDDIGDGEGDVHEVEFLKIATDKISVTVTTHNEHNGYYGGFSLNIEEKP